MMMIKQSSTTTPTKITTLPLILPVVPIREGVLFPSTESVLTFGRAISVNALNAVTKQNKLLILVTQKDSKVDNPKGEDLYTIGTLVAVEKKIVDNDSTNALVRGIGRVKIVNFVPHRSHLLAQVERLHDVIKPDNELKAMANHLQKEFRKAIHLGKPVEFLNFMKLMGGVTDGELTDQIASTLAISTKEKQQVLETTDVKARMKLVIEKLAHEMKVLEIEKDVVFKTQKKFDKNMREGVLRERLRTIQKELGDLEDDEEVADDYEKRLKKLDVDADIKKKIKKEVKRLRQMSPNNPEAGYVRTWLDTVFELPWGITKEGKISIKSARQALEKTHFGLEKVKDRILEYIAVMELKKANKKISKTSNKEDKDRLPTILCFVGPPGVGKTSIGRSIADSLGRSFVKASLGGIRDEAEIRGHRRTYVGAMPGRIISSMKQAGSLNPVFMLDEIDKVGNDFRGDPSSALLEALDPEQNSKFSDHYLDLPFDLSQVIFITTANTTDTIPPALKDRLEIIRYSGYTELEKFEIAKRHLLEKSIAVNGLSKRKLKLPDATMKKIIRRYTREAGVRELERTLNTVMRKMATKIVEKKIAPKTLMSVSGKELTDLLGPEMYDVNLTEAKDLVGLATGLAWTSVGGDVLFIEVALTEGKGKIQLTGKLGDVMKESAQAALTYVKAHAKELGIDIKKLAKTDVHIHVPEGAIPKDGPSAGVTITTALTSALTNIPVKREVAMTGEMTLRGRVLRIGGLKEKSIAAHRAGSNLIIIPASNSRDLIDIPKSVKQDVKFKPVDRIEQVLEIALKKSPFKKSK
jgi:ATP-dependent Lon protease